VFCDGVAETTISVSPALRAIRSSSSDGATADARCAERCADVEERELCDLGAKVWHDHSDPDELSFREGAECAPARVEVMLEVLPMCRDGVLAVPVWVPGG